MYDRAYAIATGVFLVAALAALLVTAYWLTGADPDRDVLMAQIEDDRVNKRAQRYLRDLRRDAVIEYN